MNGKLWRDVFIEIYNMIAQYEDQEISEIDLNNWILHLSNLTSYLFTVLLFINIAHLVFTGTVIVLVGIGIFIVLIVIWLLFSGGSGGCSLLRSLNTNK